MILLDDWTYNNEEERELGQIHAIHVHMNAIAAVRSRIRSGPSLQFCIDCDEEIPLKRRQAVQGCSRCFECQSLAEN